MSRRRSHVARPALVGVDPLVLRARRLRRRGEYRKAAIAMRELVFREPSAGRWVQLGHLLALAGRAEQAIDAYKQGQWLHRRGGHPRKAAIVASIIASDRAAA
jgi:uncharacterized protein HemY